MVEEEGCFVCYWVLRGWFPLFEVPSAESNGKDGYANYQELSASFLELEEQPVRGLGSPSLVKSREKATYKDCLKVWNTIESDPKARYLAQFVSQLGSYEWNANTACRCIGMCGYDTYVSFQCSSAKRENFNRYYNRYYHENITCRHENITAIARL